MVTTTKQTEDYLAEHPSIKDCLKINIINYSKLARKIAKELKIEKKTSMEAILIACRRYVYKIKSSANQEKKILNVLKDSELEIKNKIVSVIINKTAYQDYSSKIIKEDLIHIYYALEGTKVFTVIASEKSLSQLKNIFGRKIIKISTNLVMLTVKSPQELETTPGVVSYLYSIFSDHGINIVETMSCWTDTIFLISENDVSAVMKFLRF
jgi:acetolactate synthase small subunit